jgi:hypothetical protein
VTVLNGSGVSGAATKAASALTAEGFTATVGGDAPTSDHTKTLVEYGDSRVQSSQTVAAAITGSVRKHDSSLGDSLTVVIGKSYSGVVPVTVGSASPSATPTIHAMSAAKGSCLS